MEGTAEQKEVALPVPRNYVIYDANGTRLTSMRDVARRCADADVVLMGEVHTNQATHDAERHLLQALHEEASSRQRRVALSLEMFESDVQPIIDSYLAGVASEEDLRREARPWPNYFEDYHSLVEHCREKGMHVVAANAPRRTVSYIGKHGVDAFAAKVKEHGPSIAPTPWPYEPLSDELRNRIIAELGAAYGPSASEGDDGGGACPHVGWTKADARHALFDAQALWDASMAHHVARAASDRRTAVLHVCGKFHCERRLGIPERLPSSLRTALVVCVPWSEGGLMSAATFRRLHLHELGDFVVLTEHLPSEEAGDPHAA